MIRAAMQGKDGRPIVLLGISRENVDRMMKGDPILIDAKELGFDGRICIVGAEDENTLMETFIKNGLVTKDTALSIDPRTIPDHPPARTEDIVDTIVLHVPDDLVPAEDTVHDTGPVLQTKLRDQAMKAVAGQHMPNVRKVEMLQITWALSSNADDVAAMTPHHDCDGCRDALVRGAQYLRENPGKWLAVGRLVYRKHYADNG